MTTEIVTAIELAKMAGIQPQTVYFHIRNRRLPANRILGQYVFSRECAERFVAERGTGFRRGPKGKHA